MSESEIRGHIAIVEGNQNLCSQLHDLLVSRNYRVSTYSNAKPALDDLSTEGQTWDAILIDFYLYKTDEASIADRMKLNSSEVPIVLTKENESLVHGASVDQQDHPILNIDPHEYPKLLQEIEKLIEHNKVGSLKSQEFKRVQRPGQPNEAMIGHSPKFMEAIEVATQVSRSQANVFISGESGTGKEVFARFIHDHSRHADGSFVAINCSAIPESLLESELFGHAKGAFTGACEKKIGLFEEAQDGTLFLDEIGDLSLSLQAKLLRVLQERTIKRVGENQFRPINARIISATHKDLGKEVNSGRFREDLFYRLSVVPLHIPSLRERRDDILPLAESFLSKLCRRNEIGAKKLADDAKDYLICNPWRGNIRELENAIERAVILSKTDEIYARDFTPSLIDERPKDLPQMSSAHRFVISFDQQLPSLNETIQKYIEFAVGFNHGAKDRTAKEIGIDRKTLYRRLQHPMGNHSS